MRRVTAVLVVPFLLTSSLAVARCSDGSTSSARVRVPHLVGTSRRHAEERLAARGLRWRFAGSSKVHSTPPSPNTGSSGDSVPVTRQRPRAGRLVRRNAVVTISTSCDGGTGDRGGCL